MDKSKLKAFRRGQTGDDREVLVEIQLPNKEHATWGVGNPMKYYVSCLVEADGTVRVWDEVSDCYTIVHNLPDDLQQCARELAKKH